MGIKEAYCSFEVSRLLQEKGFNEKTLQSYDSVGFINSKSMCSTSDIPMPTHQMAMAWLREVHNLHCDIDPSEGDWKPNIVELENWSCVDDGSIPICDTYEEAVEEALRYSLENLI